MSSPGRRRRRHQRPWKRSMVATRWNDTSYLPSPYIPAIRSLLPPPPLPFNGARGREQVGKILRVSTSSTELHELSCGVTRYPPPSRLLEPRCQGNWLLRDTLVIPYPAWRACSNFKSSLHRKTSRDTVRKPERWSKENVTVQFRSFFLSSFLFFRFVSKRGHERRVGRVHARHAWLKPREKRPGTEKSVRPRFFSVPLIGKKKKKKERKNLGIRSLPSAAAQRFAQRFAHKSHYWNFISLWKFTRAALLWSSTAARKVFEPAMSCKSIADASFQLARLPTTFHASRPINTWLRRRRKR